ncbi:hypothetical protein BJ980_001746 [Nocardioides daedukensis]|uniref:Pirin family protein n=1 Tax=Nocardioides daedukensis TaxID=634462 RepID=A0A7Y9S275_9ACTN|nr:pirin family protein [Nocardioides daedukensis]NYG58823.1 hypothetical protein [Nocardioides daedukensis]
MSNLERDPDELVCTEGTTDLNVEILAPREVPLGGPRAMLVRRTLPQRQRSLIGAWCFVDHYGPDDVRDTAGMSVPPHPHTGLSTVSWLFTGEIQHRDSAGNEAMVVPGEVNLMTAGRGISHSEVSTQQTGELHGVQLWVALPDATRHVAPDFQHFAPELLEGPGWSALVFIGDLLGQSSPVETHTPMVGAELRLSAGTTFRCDVDATFEHGLLLDTGPVSVAGQEVNQHDLAYLAPGCSELVLEVHQDTRLMLIGGPPFGESIVMWWNFVGRNHEEVVQFRSEWQDQITSNGELVANGRHVSDGRFGVVSNEPLAPLPAPALPNARLRERR